MNLSESLYCKIFIDTDEAKEVILKKLSLIVSGKIELRTVTSKWCEMDLVKNDDFDEIKRLEFPDGFLFYKYYLDIDPKEGISREEYILNIGNLLEKLWKKSWKAVAASDFESELPKKGGYGII